MTYECNICSISFSRKQHYDRHLNSNKHALRVSSPQTLHICEQCSRSFSFSSGLYKHRKRCRVTTSEEEVADAPATVPTDDSIDQRFQEMREALDEERKIHQQERDELRAHISLLLDRQATVNNTNTTNSNNNTSIENQNNTINININAFGKENMDYIDEGVVTSCLDRVFKSIPTLLEHIHFDPAHPENHNIKITNKKLPYASVMDENKKWKTVNKKDAIETMVTNGYNILDEKYGDYKDALSARRQQHFENFQNRYEDEDKDLMKQLKNEVELMVINGPPEA